MRLLLLSSGNHQPPCFVPSTMPAHTQCAWSVHHARVSTPNVVEAGTVTVKVYDLTVSRERACRDAREKCRGLE